MPAKDAKVANDAKWALAGDRGITYSASMPDGTEITLATEAEYDKKVRRVTFKAN